MQSAEHRAGLHIAVGVRPAPALARRLTMQRWVTSFGVVVLDDLTQHASEVSAPQGDDVVGALAADGADDPLREAVARRAGFSLTQAPRIALTLLWLSLTSTPLDKFGGTIHALPEVAELFILTDPSGNFAATFPWPSGVPAGTELHAQLLVQDGSTPFGISLSNAVVGTAP